MNRLVKMEDYDRKRYDLDSEYLKCPITNKEFDISLKYDNDDIVYTITSPTDNNYKESRFLIFNFHPGNPGYIINDEISWENKPVWNFPLK